MSEITSSHINKELESISKWLKLNKLSLDMSLEYQKIIRPTLFIDNVNIDCVDEFIFLGIFIRKK